MTRRRRRDNPHYLEIPDAANQLRTWTSNRDSALINVKGSFRERGKARDVAASMVAIIQTNKCPVIWALSPRSGNTGQLSSLDILKYLTLQILQVNKSHLRDGAKPLSAVKFQCARTDSEWFELLGESLVGLSEIYIVLDIETFRSDTGNGRAWSTAFIKLFETLAAQNPRIVVKVAIISYHTQLESVPLDITKQNVMQLNIRTKETRQKVGRNKDLRLKLGMRSRRQVC